MWTRKIDDAVLISEEMSTRFLIEGRMISYTMEVTQSC